MKKIPFLNNHNGFNMLEIIVVIIIVAVLASLSLPNLSNTVERTRSAEGVQILGALLSAQKVYEFEEGSYATTVADLDVEIPTPTDFNNVTDNNVCSAANRVAWVQRTGAYVLCINEDGDITCNPNGGGNICKKLNFTEETGTCTASNC